MTPKQARKRADELAGQLTRYQHAYFVDARPLVTDAEYDRLFDELARLEAEFPELARPDSPTRRVGSDLTQELPEVPHGVPVLSLDKCYAADELTAWAAKTAKASGAALSFTCEEKIDGASIVLYYEDGVLARAVTRGNGLVGNDVTGNVRTIGSVPLKLSRPLTVAARGEIYLARELFASLNASMEEPYANPRNMAAGSLRRVKSSEVASIPLSIYVYEGFFPEQPSTHVAALEDLEALGFRTNPRVGYFSDGPGREAVRERHPGWTTGPVAEMAGWIEAERSARQGLPYEIDGVVIKVNEMRAREALGSTGHHPRWAVAFKFESPEGATTVNAIDVQVGRTGRITPVARVEPVKIAGATISNVTLHNEEYIDLLELAIGDRVAVSRRGDVIPAVERVLEKNETGATTWKMPTSCPTCAAPLEKNGAHHFCPNSGCPDQVRGRLVFFSARGQMDIDGLGPETIDVLVKEGLVADIDDLYFFDPARLLDLPGFGEKKVAQLRAGIEKSRAQPFTTVFPSLGLPDIGPKVTELLVDAGFGGIAPLLEIADKGDPAPLLTIHGIGERTAATLIAELVRPEVRRRIRRLTEAGLQMAGATPRVRSGTPGPFDGETWCVTGSFASFSPREKAMELVARLGGRVTASISAKTTHLLAGEKAGSKLTRARELGVTVVGEEEFRALVRERAGLDFPGDGS
jgi:DNA ligase (NAD+)